MGYSPTYSLNRTGDGDENFVRKDVVEDKERNQLSLENSSFYSLEGTRRWSLACSRRVDEVVTAIAEPTGRYSQNIPISELPSPFRYACQRRESQHERTTPP